MQLVVQSATHNLTVSYPRLPYRAPEQQAKRRRAVGRDAAFLSHVGPTLLRKEEEVLGGLQFLLQFKRGYLIERARGKITGHSKKLKSSRHGDRDRR